MKFVSTFLVLSIALCSCSKPGSSPSASAPSEKTDAPKALSDQEKIAASAAKKLEACGLEIDQTDIRTIAQSFARIASQCDLTDEEADSLASNL